MSNNMLPSSVIDQNRDRISVNNLFYSRIDNAFLLSVGDNTDGIYAATFNPIQTEHLLIIENETVFKDIIWSLFTGSRQNRIKLAGYKTDLWDGSQQLPGYVLLDDTVNDWDANKSYPIGEIVKFKNKPIYKTLKIKYAINSPLKRISKPDVNDKKKILKKLKLIIVLKKK